MSKEIDDGGPAFPSEQHECHDHTWNQTYEPGMSLRDWFAGQSVIGIAVAGNIVGGNQPDTHATIAYSIADAMIAARKK